jgi:hypothetical protein
MANHQAVKVGRVFRPPAKADVEITWRIKHNFRKVLGTEKPPGRRFLKRKFLRYHPVAEWLSVREEDVKTILPRLIE